MLSQNRCRIGIVVMALAVVALPGQPVRGQGLSVDADGHALLNGNAVLACWNFAAGADIPEDYARYPEFLPFLQGWDFRINLPHVQFQLARPSGGGASHPAMVGVEEGGELTRYGHVNNSIWLFQMDSGEGRFFAKVIPSRRDLNGSTTQNASSLTANWFEVGAGIGEGVPVEKPAAAVVGKGLGVARIYLVARDREGGLHMSAHTVTGLEGTGPPVFAAGLPVFPGLGAGWPEPWRPLGVSSVVQPVLSEAFDGKLALAWIDAGLHVQIYDPATNTLGPPTPIGGAAVVTPQLIWDGTALNLLFVGSGSPALQHAYALADDPLTFYARRAVSSLVAVRGHHFHGMFFNRRLHVVIQHDNGTETGPVFYTTSTTDPGRPSSWSIPSETGITTITQPRVAWLNENIVVLGANFDGRVRYARKDPNRPGNELTGAALADRWLQPGQDVDPTAAGFFDGLQTLTFNGDVYLAARKGGAGAGTFVVNFSRAAMKQLVTQKWGMRLLWGEPGGSRPLRPGEFASGTEIPAVGDLDGNGFDDLINFTQTFSADGQAPVYVRLNIDGDFISNALWTPVFSLPGEIPMVGNFDGDHQDDIISFAQRTQLGFDGELIGHAPVRVMLSNGSQGGPQLWHDEFSREPEIPMVGDFNGDGLDDIISFTQKLVTDFDGGLVGESVVLVALSDGTRFGPAQIWHTNFSPPGEIPMVGDFNGDGLDDIVSFSQRPLLNSDGSVQATAPVWVALSHGTGFGQATIWHTFFCPEGEVPQVADLNMDGADDIITFLADKPGAGDAARNIYVAFSGGNRFQRSTVWHSDFVRSSHVRLGPGKRVYSPQIGHVSNRTLGTWTGVPADFQRPVLDIITFPTDGSVHTARTMGNVPYPSGAPWERYKWFTEKGIGVALFPEWIYEGPGHCIAGNHRFALNGAGGVGGGDLTVSSVRFGGRAPHVLEELGHSIFANCFRPNSDPFNLVAGIFVIPPGQGGMGSNELPGCENNTAGFHSCRPDDAEEHYFLQLLSRYRLDPEFFRERIAAETNPAAQATLAAQYEWLKHNWFEGLEFATAPAANASLPQRGVPLLPAALPPIVPVDEPVGPGDPDDPDDPNAPGAACGDGAACGAGAPLALLVATGMIRYRTSSRRARPARR